MKIVIALAMLVAAVVAKPQRMSLEHRIDASFTRWLLTEKKEVIYPPGFKNKVCDGNDCCDSNSCEHGSCSDVSSGDEVASRYGYTCTGAECGTKTGQYSGLLCDQLAESACEVCARKHGKYTVCYSHTKTLSGYVCLLKQEGTGDYNALDRREFDVLYGEGTASQLEKIAKEETEAETGDKESLTALIRELINELE